MSEPQSRRFHVSDFSDAAPAELDLPAAEAHHALHVLRLREGDAVELFDGRGRRGEATIARTRRDDVTVALQNISSAGSRPEPVVHLAFAAPKGKRLDWLLEKATELDAATLQPIVFARSVAARGVEKSARHGRWLGHCIAAAKQSGLNWLPEVAAPLSLEKWLEGEPEGHILYGDCGEATLPLREALAEWQPGQGIWLVVGPEGGPTDAEAEALQRRGAQGIRLGHTTLRIETAAVALLSATRACLG